MEDVRKKIFKNSSLWVFSFIFQQLVRFLIVYLIAHFFGKSVFGAYSMVLTFVAFFTLISRHGWEYSFIKYIQHYIVKGEFGRLKGVISSGFLLPLLFSFFLSFILYLNRDFFIRAFFKGEYGIFFSLLIFFIPIHTLLQLTLYFIEGLKHSGIRAFLERVGITFLHLLLLLLLSGLGSMSTILSYFFASTVVLFVSFYVGIRILKGENIFKRIKSAKAVINIGNEFKYGLNLFSDAFINFLINRMDILFLGFFAFLGDVGVYSLTTRLTMVLVLFYSAFDSILTPIISENFARKDFKSIEKLYREITWWGIAFTLPLAIFYFLMGKDLLLFFGRGFDMGFWALLILTIAQLVNVLVGSAGNIVAVCGYPKLSFYNSFSVAILSVILNLTLIPKYGVLGVAISTGSSIFVLNFLRGIELYIIFKLHPFNKAYFSILFASFVAATVGYFFKNYFLGEIFRIFAVAFLVFVSYIFVFIIAMPRSSRIFLVDFLKRKNKSDL